MAGLVVAAIQAAAHDRGSFHLAWPEITAAIAAAASSGAQLTVLPEATLPAYVMGTAKFDEAETSAALEECRALARRHGLVIVAGAVRKHEGRLYNSALVIDRDGSIAGAADKQFLWDFDRHWFTPGERAAPIATSIARIGALVCADGRIPTIARALVDAGAQILVMPTAWVTSGRDPLHLENAQADLLARVRARENGVPFVAANKCGAELGCVAYCGKSQIVDAEGELVSLASQDRTEVLVAEIEVGAQPHRLHALPEPPPASARGFERFAICASEIRDSARRLEILGVRTLLGANDCGDLPRVGDREVLDPGSLAAYRLAGHDIIVWNSSMEPVWQQRFARARALELRIFLVVIDEGVRRAYAVDPEGTILCGTFGAFEIACFNYDPERTRQTLVAPGTDVLKGLQHAAQA